MKLNIFHKTVAHVSYILSSSNLKNTIYKCIKQISDWHYSKLTSSKIRAIYIVLLHGIVLCIENCFSHMYNSHTYLHNNQIICSIHLYCTVLYSNFTSVTLKKNKRIH